MARKTVQEKIANFRINSRYDANFQDMEEILQFSNDPFRMFYIAFKYGYLQGSKAMKKELKGERV